MMEPYQPGKIPVVFIHGLGSDPLTWTDATNCLRAQGDIYRRYQLWYFRYPTGGDLLESAAALRESCCWPARPAIRGTAIRRESKWFSSDIAWGARCATPGHLLLRHPLAACRHRPIEAVRATPRIREELQRNFFFDPSPLVKRVVFMATPHHGSNMARRLVGRVASKFVHYSADEEAAYRRLMD